MWLCDLVARQCLCIICHLLRYALVTWGWPSCERFEHGLCPNTMAWLTEVCLLVFVWSVRWCCCGNSLLFQLHAIHSVVPCRSAAICCARPTLYSPWGYQTKLRSNKVGREGVVPCGKCLIPKVFRLAAFPPLHYKAVLSITYRFKVTGYGLQFSWRNSQVDECVCCDQIHDI